jgi:AraC-like DNA-binding protein
VAVRVGYSTPSAFGAAFRAELGSAPGSWFARPGHDAHTVTSDGAGSG